MGGADTDNVTLKVIQALAILDEPDLEVKIVVGPANPNIESLKKELSTFQKNNIKLQTIGQIKNLPKNAQKKLQEVIKATENNTAMVLNLALSYGSREEFVNAIKNISKKIVNKDNNEKR